MAVAESGDTGKPLLQTIEFVTAPGKAPLLLRVPHLTILVGPNNSGKSIALREIEQSVSDPQFSGRVIRRATLTHLTGDELLHLIRSFVNERAGQLILPGVQPVHVSVKDGRIEPVQLRDPRFHPLVARAMVLSLDGATRLRMVEGRQFQGWNFGSADDPWSALYKNREARRRFTDLVYRALNRHIALDLVTQSGYLNVRVLDAPVPSELQEVNTQAAADLMSSGTLATEMSDGFKAYCGVLAAVTSGRHRLILIDEPDAFLHPPLVRALGEHLARTAAERAAQVFAATHDSDFVFGAVSSGAQVSIVRLTFDGRTASVRLLEPDVLTQLMRDPYVRETGVLDSLFHQSVVVCEGHADRVLYGEVNARLVRQSRGIPDCLFLNAGGWGNIRKIVSPLRRLGINVAAVLDLDALRKTEFTALLREAGVPSEMIQGYGQMIGDIRKSLDEEGGNLKDGVGALKGVSEAVTRVCRALQEHGIFLVPTGELEGWLGREIAAVSKEHYMDAALTALERFTEGATLPTEDVWQFLDEVGAWMKRQDRR